MEHHVVGLKELREHVERYITEVKKGKSFTVLRRSKPVFRITGPNEEDLWETVVDFTKIRKGGVPVGEVLKKLRLLNGSHK